MTTIEKNIPLPALGNASHPISPLLRALEVGDSADLSGYNLGSVKSAAYAMPGKKFSIRKNSKGATVVWRIWRTA